MGENNRLAKINRITSVNLTSSFIPTDPNTEIGTIFDILLKVDRILVKQSHTADLARKRSRYDIADQNGFPLLRGFQRSRRYFSIIPDPIRVYNTGLQTPLLEIRFEFTVARFKNAEVFASNSVSIGSVKRNIDVNGFILHNQRDGYLFNAQKVATETAAEIKFTITSQENKSEVASVIGKNQVDYTLKLNEHERNTTNTKALLLGFILYYDTMRR